jgi:hypothetical protein
VGRNDGANRAAVEKPHFFAAAAPAERVPAPEYKVLRRKQAAGLQVHVWGIRCDGAHVCMGVTCMHTATVARKHASMPPIVRGRGFARAYVTQCVLS